MRILILMLVLASSVCADFSYTTTIKGAGPAAGAVTKHKIKGNKMKIDTGSNIIISDLDAQTVTSINVAAKTYSVSSITQPGSALAKSGMEVKAEVKDTGQQKHIGGFNCRQIIMSMTMTGQPMAMNMENEMWVSADVPGAAELKAVGIKMAEKGLYPASGDARSSRMMADLQKQMAKVNGIPVLQITRMKSGDDEKSKQMQAQMQAMRAKMEAMKKAGGKQAEMAEKAMAAMGGAGNSKYLMEITSESSAFSTATIPASEFAIPAGFKKADR